MASDANAVELVDRLGMIVIRGTDGESAVEKAAAEALEAIEAGGDRASIEANKRAILMAQRSFYLGFFQRGEGRERDAERLFERAAETAREAVRERPTSEGMRVLSDALQQLLELRGSLYQLLNFRAARDAAFEAIELDNENPAAYLAAVSYLATAPAAGGGDKEEAQRYLDRASALLADRDDTSSVMNLRFLVAVWQALLEASKGNTNASSRAFERAEEIYPENWWLAEMRAAVTDDLRNQ